MSYLEKTLQPGETVLYQTRLHWIVYLPAALVLAAGILVVAFSGTAGFLGVAGSALVLGGFVLAFIAWIRRLSTEMAITNRRVVTKYGVIWRKTLEMERQKVESVSVDQSILGRLFDYGTITVRGTGSTFEPVTDIDQPLQFRNKLLAG